MLAPNQAELTISTGFLVGGVSTGAAVILILIVVVVILARRKKKERDNREVVDINKYYGKTDYDDYNGSAITESNEYYGE